MFDKVMNTPLDPVFILLTLNPCCTSSSILLILFGILEYSQIYHVLSCGQGDIAVYRLQYSVFFLKFEEIKLRGIFCRKKQC